MEYQAKPPRSIQRPPPSPCVDSCAYVGMRDGPSIPEVSETSLEDGVEGGGVDPHGGDESAVFVFPVETYPRCADARVGE